jgi:hypothetical protein
MLWEIASSSELILTLQIGQSTLMIAITKFCDTMKGGMQVFGVRQAHCVNQYVFISACTGFI